MVANVFANMNDKSAPRGFNWIWFIRFAQIGISVIVLGLAAYHSSVFKSDGCDIPGKISYNLACAVISLFVLAYLILSTGPSNVFKVLPWLVWGQLALDGVMFIFWIAAAGTSNLSNQDIFNACYNAYLSDLNYDPSIYDPNSYDYTYNSKRGLLEARRGRKSSSSSGVHSFTWGSVHARTALDAIMVVLFVVTLASTIWWVYQEHRPTGTAAPTTQPQAHDGLGGGAGVPIVAPQEPTATYSQPQMQQQQQQYYQGQPQPSPAGYNQSIPQAQYSQPTTGYPSPQMQPANPTYSTGVPVSGH